MAIRLLVIVLLAVGVFYVFNRLRVRMAADPRLRHSLAAVGKQLLRVLLLRASWPFLLKALRSLRFFW
jgi:hypothetical protein